MTNSPSTDLHNRGWGFALFIVVLAIVVNVAVFSIHKATYLQPRDHAPAGGAAH